MTFDPSRVVRALTARVRRRPNDPAPAPVLSNASLVQQVHHQFQLGRRDIETTLDDPLAARRLMDRVITQWHKLGESDPFWSNDTRDLFKKENLDDAAMRRFYAEGEGVLDIIAAFENRSGVTLGDGVCVELGCGVGKHTHALARRFSQVIAIDVSAGGLAICEQRMKQLGLDRVTTKLLTTPDDLAKFGTIDVFFSLSVLQHNPPPIQKVMLVHALANLRPGGFCLFQTPDWIENYTFATQRFLDEPDAMFDLHCLPKTDVFALFDAQEMQLLDIAPDLTIGSFGSYTYFARKRPGRPGV